ncbi:MAG: acyl-CoA dehydrogenase family protein, partial [Sneathiella sp.]
KYLLEFERFSMGSIELRRTLDRVEKLAAETAVDGKLLSDDVEFKQKLATLTIETMVLEASEQRVLSKLSAGKSPGAASSLQKLHHSELVQRADELGAEVLGYYAAPHQPEALDMGTNVAAVGPENGITFMPMYLSNRMKTIAGGSSEVLRNVAAKTILGL